MPVSIQQKYQQQSTKRGINDRVVRYKCFFANAVADVLRARGWQEVRDRESTDWDFYWCDVSWIKENFDRCYLAEHMRVNHFRNHYELTRKNLMVKNLKRMKKQYEREGNKQDAARCDFFPPTYEMPAEYHLFVEEYKRNVGMIWIAKPTSRAQGKGIFLFKKLKDVVEWKKYAEHQEKDSTEPYIVQRYIDEPCLVGCKKFDIRIYVLVMSFLPLKVWLYREGFARFSSSHYSKDSIDDMYVHLTNVAIQKTATDYDPDKGLKWSLFDLRMYLTAKHGIAQIQRVLQEINDIVVYSLLSVQKCMINDKHCYELYGYDIMLDKNLKPWLIEVNASPSLTASSQEDYELKFRLIDDVVYVVDMEGRLNGKDRRVGGFDLIWNNGPVTADDGAIGCQAKIRLSSPSPLFLGARNNREEQLHDLFKDENPPVVVSSAGVGGRMPYLMSGASAPLTVMVPTTIPTHNKITTTTKRKTNTKTPTRNNTKQHTKKEEVKRDAKDDDDDDDDEDDDDDDGAEERERESKEMERPQPARATVKQNRNRKIINKK